MIKINKNNILASKNEIIELETLVSSRIQKNIHLAKDYTDFLLEYNGCNFEDDCIKYKYFYDGVDNEIEIGLLCSIKDVFEWIESLEYNSEFDQQYLNPLIKNNILTRIGFEKWGGDEISIGMGEKNNGHIYISKLYSAIDFVKIANSFDEFINGLFEDEDC